MKILIVPMAALAETHGPASRCRSLALGFKNAGFEVATCMAKDVNYKVIEDVPNYYLDVPMPLGLPEFYAKKVFPIAQKLGITSKKTVSSFDQVLGLTGNLDHDYLKRSVSSVRKSIQDYKPDIVYSEFNISAIIAAKKEGIPLYATVSYPTQYEYAHKDETEKGLNRVLEELQLPKVDSPLRLFDLADKRFCLSISELEPIDKPNVIYCGTLKTATGNYSKSCSRNKIVVYMGNGTVSAKEMLRVIKGAFSDSNHDVYIASSYLEKSDTGNIHIAPRWDFDKLLEETAVFINHGGQNSVVDGLNHGVPQIVVPGKVFERRYNAGCLVSNSAGIMIENHDFNAAELKDAVEKITSSQEMAENAAVLGKKLREAGGIDTIIRNTV